MILCFPIVLGLSCGSVDLGSPFLTSCLHHYSKLAMFPINLVASQNITRCQGLLKLEHCNILNYVRGQMLCLIRAVALRWNVLALFSPPWG